MISINKINKIFNKINYRQFQQIQQFQQIYQLQQSFNNQRFYVSDFHVNLIKNIINDDSKLNQTSNKKKEFPKKLRPHVNPFSVRNIIETPKWNEIYSNLQLPIHIDLGCGQGEMLYERSKLQNKNMLGIDMRDIYIEIAKSNQINNSCNNSDSNNNNSKISNNSINNNNNNNLHYILANINLNIKNLGLPKELLKEVSIFFPDPWFKNSHVNRRLVNPKLVEDLYDISADDVSIYIQSDCNNLSLEIQQFFKDSNKFKQVDISKAEWDSLFPKTKYQKLFPQDPNRLVFKKIIQ